MKSPVDRLGDKDWSVNLSLRNTSLTPKTPTLRNPSPSTSHKRYRESSFLFFPQSSRADSTERKSISLEKPENLETKYENLRINYQILLEENGSLKAEIAYLSNHQSTKSTLNIYDHENFKHSYAEEIENLHEIISKAHDSIQILLQQLRIKIGESQDLKKSLNYMRFNLDMSESTKDVKITLLEETLMKKLDETSDYFTETQNLKKMIDDLTLKLTEKTNDYHSLSQRLEILQRNFDPEQLKTIDLIQKLSKMKKRLRDTAEKANHYEEFIKTNLKNKNMFK